MIIQFAHRNVIVRNNYLYWLLVERYSSRVCSSKGFLCVLWERWFRLFLARLHSLSNQILELLFDFLFCFTIFNDWFAAVSNIFANFSTMTLISPTCSKFESSKSWISCFISSELSEEVKDSLIRVRSVDHLKCLGRLRSSSWKLSSSLVNTDESIFIHVINWQWSENGDGWRTAKVSKRYKMSRLAMI